MSKAANKLSAVAGFVYGVGLAFYAVAWGVDGPTLTMPLAASPLNVPAAILDNANVQLELLMPVLIVVPIIAAPFCWATMAVSVTSAHLLRSRMILASVLIAHYIGIALWFVLFDSNYLLRPFRVLVSEGKLLLAFYGAGQVLFWWALLRPRAQRTESLKFSER